MQFENNQGCEASIEFEGVVDELIGVSCLIVGMLCCSTLAVAESPIPFNALMQAAAAQTAVPPMPDARSNSTAATTQSTNRGPMTSGGRVMTGVGIALLGVGAGLIGVGASVNEHGIGGSEVRSIGMGAGAGFAGIGIALIILGTHKRKAK